MVTAYQKFVRDNMGKFKHLPAKDRMKAVANLYRRGGEMTAAGLDEKGGSIFGDIIPFGNELGLGLDEKGGKMKRGRGRPRRGGSLTAGDLDGAGLLSSLTGMLGLGLDEKGGKMKRGRGRPRRGGAMSAGSLTAGDLDGAGLLSSLTGMLGLGLDEKGGKMKRGRGRPRKARGGAYTGAGVDGDDSGGGIFGSIGDGVDSIGHLFGLGLDGGKIKHKCRKCGNVSGGDLSDFFKVLVGGKMKRKGGSMVVSPTMNGDTGGDFLGSFAKGLSLPFQAISSLI